MAHLQAASFRFQVVVVVVAALLLCFEALPCALDAQIIPISPKTIRDSKGKDFWMAFPRNHHANGGGNFDRLYISVVSERPTRGKIEYQQGGRQQVQTFDLRANDVYTFDIASAGLELDAQAITRKAFHITADEEVTVYGLNVASVTSDAFLAFPTDVLGREHVIASFVSNISLRQGGAVDEVNTTMPQFAVVAAFDSTVVTITPTVKTWNGDSTAYSITLNQGECYLVSLFPTAANRDKDFTGSRVSSSKPVVVYGGHERALLQGTSRDHLVEQMLPVEVWGKTALVIPYPAPTRGTPDLGCDRIRVIAGYDNTLVTVNNTTVATLRAGGFYEMVITTEASIVTSEPSVVAGYKCSGSSNAGGIGDPFLALIPPVEQFLTRYRFVCVQGTQVANGGINRTEPAFLEHYVTIVVPTTKATTVVLNGNTVAPQFFRRVQQTGYSYAIVPIFEGIHSISADTTFGITVAGYGRANSYGYIGGQRFETDIRPPQIVVRRTCTGLDGKIFDSAFTDSKIFFYDTLRATQRNVRFRFGNLPRPADSLSFQADLLNPYEDGIVGLVAVDSLDLRSVQRVIVPGFTVHRDPSIRTDAIVTTSSIIRLATGRDYCFRLNLSNYGATNQTVQSVGFTRGLPQFSSSSFRPTRIEPSSQGTVEYCFRTDQDGTFTDTLTISNGCLTRRILAIRIEAAQDRLPPTLTRSADDCNRVITLETSDNRTFDAGLARVEMVLVNMTATQAFVGNAEQVQDSTKRPLRITLAVTNPRADAIFAVTLTDSVGNTTVLRDTIPGFTARFVASADTTSGALRIVGGSAANGFRYEYRFQPTDATTLTCGTILMQNTGIVPFVLNRSAVNRNLQFSLPSSQFPFVIPAGATRALTVCFNPALVAEYRDTLGITKSCVTESVTLVGEGLAGYLVAGSRCNAEIRLRPLFGTGVNPLGNLAQTLRVRHFPDPAESLITLQVELPSAEALTVRLYSMMGVMVASLPKQALERGVWDIALKLDTVETGTYYCEVLSDTTEKRWTGLVRVAR